MLDIRDLAVSFARYAGFLGRESLTVLDGVDLAVGAGELVAVIGASGAGKSLLAHAVLGILPANAVLSGEIRFHGEALTPRRQRALRGRRIALVPQGVTSLDPTASARRQVAWAARQAPAADAAPPGRRAVAELARYDLPPASFGLFPHQLSGGMARRVLTATATVSGAELLIADEPTAGLDPAARRLALETLRRLADGGRSVLVITHDVNAVLPFADRIAVLYAGQTVETFRAEAFAQARHPYTVALRQALPQHGLAAAPRSSARPMPPSGCRYGGECPAATALCAERPPAWRETASGRARCHHA